MVWIPGTKVEGNFQSRGYGNNPEKGWWGLNLREEMCDWGACDKMGMLIKWNALCVIKERVKVRLFFCIRFACEGRKVSWTKFRNAKDGARLTVGRKIMKWLD